jgi:hypothetical protein
VSRERNDDTEDNADLIEIGDVVTIARSGETGVVDGFMAIGGDEPQFWLLYTDNCGSARSAWFRAGELDPPKAAGSDLVATDKTSNIIAFPVRA